MAKIKAFLSQDSDRAIVKAFGADATRFLHGQLSCDVKRMAEQTGPTTAHGFFLDLKGKIRSPVQILKLSGESYLLSVPLRLFEQVHQGLQKFVIADQVDLEHEPMFKHCTSVFDLDRNVNDDLLSPKNPMAKDSIFKAEQQNKSWLVPVGNFGSHHFEIWSQSALQIPLFEQDLNHYRIQKGIPLFSVDFDVGSLPVEFPTQGSLSFYKGCFVGQEVLARATYRGQVAWQFCRIETESNVELGPVFAEGNEQPVGQITTVYQNLALARLRRQFVQTTEQLWSHGSGGKIKIKNIEALVP